jgi:hypothetical protein
MKDDDEEFTDAKAKKGSYSCSSRFASKNSQNVGIDKCRELEKYTFQSVSTFSA